MAPKTKSTGTGAAFFFQNISIKYNLNTFNSVHSIETFALLLKPLNLLIMIP